MLNKVFHIFILHWVLHTCRIYKEGQGKKGIYKESQGEKTLCAKDKKGGQRIVYLKSWPKFCLAKHGRRGMVTAELTKEAVTSCQAEEL